MNSLDPHTLRALCVLELSTRLSLSLVQQHPDSVIDWIPGSMQVQFDQPGLLGASYNAVVCTVIEVEFDDGSLPFSIEMKVTSVNKDTRFWTASAMNWVFAHRLEMTKPGETGTDEVFRAWHLGMHNSASETDESAHESHPAGLRLDTGNQEGWVVNDGGCPFNDPEIWDDLIRKGMVKACQMQRHFIDQCRLGLGLEPNPTSEHEREDPVDANKVAGLLSKFTRRPVSPMTTESPSGPGNSR